MQLLKGLSCCLLGDKYIYDVEKAEQDIYDVAKKLIIKHKVKNFILDIPSNFTSICISAINKLKTEFDYVLKICFGNPHELFIMSINDAMQYDKLIEIDCKDESINDLHRWHTMMQVSDFCVFYCEKNSMFVKRLKCFRWYAKKHKKKTKMILR